MVMGKLVSVILQSEPDKTEKPEYKVENRGTFAEAVNGQAYSVKLTNLAPHHIATNIYIDGNCVSKVWMSGHQSFNISEVVSKVIHVGPDVKEVYSPLVFSQPDIVEEGTTLDRTVTNGRTDSLGVIRVEVFNAYRGEALPVTRPTCDATSFAASCTEKDGMKKGAFRSTTTIGATERVSHEGPEVSEWYAGKDLLETVTLRYGSRAMLLLLGVPPYHFMVMGNNNGNQGGAAASSEAIDLTDDKDEEEEKKASDKKPAAKVKREAGAVEGSSGSSSGGGVAAQGGGAAERGGASVKRPRMSGVLFDLT